MGWQEWVHFTLLSELQNIAYCWLQYKCGYVFTSRRMRWAGHVARMGEDRGVHRVLAGKPEGNCPMERPRHSWEDNIKMDL
jgi:hypothetical protein